MDQKPRPPRIRIGPLKQTPRRENKTAAEAMTFSAMLKDALDG